MVILAQVATGEIESDMVNELCMDLLLAGTYTSEQTVRRTLVMLTNRPNV